MKSTTEGLRPNHLNTDELTMVLAALPAKWRAACAVAARTGMRPQQLVALKLWDIDLGAGGAGDVKVCGP